MVIPYFDLSNNTTVQQYDVKMYTDTISQQYLNSTIYDIMLSCNQWR